MSRKYKSRSEITKIAKRESTFIDMPVASNPFGCSEKQHITLHKFKDGKSVKVFTKWLARQSRVEFFIDHTKLGHLEVAESEDEIKSLL